VVSDDLANPLGCNRLRVGRGLRDISAARDGFVKSAPRSCHRCFHSHPGRDMGGRGIRAPGIWKSAHRRVDEAILWPPGAHSGHRRASPLRRLDMGPSPAVARTVAREVKARCAGQLGARSLHDPEIQARLDRARPGWR